MEFRITFNDADIVILNGKKDCTTCGFCKDYQCYSDGHMVLPGLLGKAVWFEDDECNLWKPITTVLIRVMKSSPVSALVKDEQTQIESTEKDYPSAIEKWRKENNE